MIVIDASAALSGLLNDGPAREAIAAQQTHVPHLIDPEVANGLRRLVVRGELGAGSGWGVLDVWRRVGVIRHPVVSLAGRIWELRGNLSAYDATYVALGEALGCALVTADARLSRAPGILCPITVVPR